MTSFSRNFSGSKVPLSQTLIVPAPYSPLGISPWNSRYSRGWSSVSHRQAVLVRVGRDAAREGP